MPSGGVSSAELSSPAAGGVAPVGGVSKDQRVKPGVVGLSTAVVHAMFDGIHAKLAADGGVLVSSADIHEVEDRAPG